jgi:hypothetical protein
VPVDTEQTHYAIRAYASTGDALRLTATRDEPHDLHATDVFAAVALLATLPAMGWLDWDDGNSEQLPIARIELWHHEIHTVRGRVRCSTNLLETITR